MSEVISFTGPARRLTEPEVDRITAVVEASPADLYVSGAAYGVDTAAALAAYVHRGCVRLAVPRGEVYNTDLVHIAEQMPGWEIEYVDGGYMARNDRLVELATVLLAFPETQEEQLRSGTWATIRRARKAGIHVALYPLSDVA